MRLRELLKMSSLLGRSGVIDFDFVFLFHHFIRPCCDAYLYDTFSSATMPRMVRRRLDTRKS